MKGSAELNVPSLMCPSKRPERRSCAVRQWFRDEVERLMDKNPPCVRQTLRRNLKPRDVAHNQVASSVASWGRPPGLLAGSRSGLGPLAVVSMMSGKDGIRHRAALISAQSWTKANAAGVERRLATR